MRRRSLFIAIATIATLLSGPLTAGAAGTASDDQARADAAIEAFSTTAEAAGYQSNGPTDQDEDILDLVPDEGSSDEDNGAYLCLGSMAALVDVDGTFVGETARTLSDEFDYVTGDVPATTDLMSFGADEDSITAAVLFVDSEHVDGLSTLVDTFGSAKLRDCLNEQFVAQLSTTDPDDTDSDLEIINSNDLGIGDHSAEFSLSFSVTFGDQTTAFNSGVAIAQVDRALVIVLSSTTDDVDGLSARDALASIVDSLGK